MATREIERAQTGVRMEKRILKVLKAFAELRATLKRHPRKLRWPRAAHPATAVDRYLGTKLPCAP